MPAGPAVSAARYLLVMLTVGVLAACDPWPISAPAGSAPPIATSPAEPAEPAELVALRARPLQLPTLAAKDRCPVTVPVSIDPPPPDGHALSNGGPAFAFGRAPVFPDARYFRGNQSELLVHAETAEPGWYTAKTPWASRAGYLGWTLIRTARLDGAGQARVELNLADGVKRGNALGVNVQADWQFWPGSTQVTGVGCYAYQVDGIGFTEVIVFDVQLDLNWPTISAPP